MLTLLISLGFALLVGFTLRLIDEESGKALTEKVKVTDRKYVAAHTRVDATGGKERVPEKRQLIVSNMNGNGRISVNAASFEANDVGSTIIVTGTKGRFSGYWYLKGARPDL